jgi:hypothetical protein
MEINNLLKNKFIKKDLNIKWVMHINGVKNMDWRLLMLKSI